MEQKPAPHLTNAELAEWVSRELRRYEILDGSNVLETLPRSYPEPHLTNAELAEWVTRELRRYETLDEGLRTRDMQIPKSSVDQDAQHRARVRAIMVGQQAVVRDLPDVTLTGDFSAAPTQDGGWRVRYAIRAESAFGKAPTGFVECVVTADGTVEGLRTLSTTRSASY